MKIILFIFIGLFCITSWASDYSSYVAKNNPLYATGQEARKEKINYEDYRKFKVLPSDNLQATYRKLILLKQCFTYNAKDAGGILELLIADSQKAHEKYPGSAAIATVYTYYRHFSPPSPEAPIYSLRIIIPYIQASNEVPAIPRVIWAIIHSTVTHFDPNCKADMNQFRKFVGGKTPQEVKANLELLANYWAMQIDPQYSKFWTPEKVDAIRKSMTSEKTEKAQAIWKNFVQESNILDKQRFRVKIVNEIAAKRLAEAKKKQEQWDEFRKKCYSDALANLDKFYTPPNNLDKITQVILGLTQYRKKLKENSNIPNYEELCKRYKNSEEAQILNAAYFIYLWKNYKKALEILNGLKCKDSDVRALFLEMYATLWSSPKSPQAIAKSLDLLKLILKIDPDNGRAKILKIRLEEKLKKIQEKH